MKSGTRPLLPQTFTEKLLMFVEKTEVPAAERQFEVSESSPRENPAIQPAAEKKEPQEAGHMARLKELEDALGRRIFASEMRRICKRDHG